jgi:hypothetical protein
MANHIKLWHKRPRGPNSNKVVHPCHIPLNKAKKTNVGGVTGLIKKMIVLTHLKLTLAMLTLTNHVLIIKFIGMMKIIVSPYIYN